MMSSPFAVRDHRRLRSSGCWSRCSRPCSRSASEPPSRPATSSSSTPYHQGFRVMTDRISAGIEAEVGRTEHEFEIHYESSIPSAIPGEAYFQAMVEFECRKTKLADLDFEVIIASDNNALRFLVEHGDELNPGGCPLPHNSPPPAPPGRPAQTGPGRAPPPRDGDRRPPESHQRRPHHVAKRTGIRVYQDFVLDGCRARFALGDDAMIYMLAPAPPGNFISSSTASACPRGGVPSTVPGISTSARHRRRCDPSGAARARPPPDGPQSVDASQPRHEPTDHVDHTDGALAREARAPGACLTTPGSSIATAGPRRPADRTTLSPCGSGFLYVPFPTCSQGPGCPGVVEDIEFSEDTWTSCGRVNHDLSRPPSHSNPTRPDTTLARTPPGPPTAPP